MSSGACALTTAAPLLIMTRLLNGVWSISRFRADNRNATRFVSVLSDDIIFVGGFEVSLSSDNCALREASTLWMSMEMSSNVLAASDASLHVVSGR
jgi:hypothetical protein